MRAFRRSIHYFDVVARTLSIRLAAEELHIAPSAVSRTIQQLEDEFGAPLFDRTARGLQLTAAGDTVLGYTHRWQHEARQLSVDVRSLMGERLETVRIAGVEVATYNVIPEAMVAARQVRPGLSVALQVGHTQAVVEATLNGTADIGVVINLPGKVPVRSLWTCCDPVGLVVPLNHRLAQRKSVALAECLEDPLILADESLMSSSAIRNVLHSAGPYRLGGTANRIVAVKSMFRAGLGVAFLTGLDVMPEIQRGELRHIPLSDPEIEHPFVSLIAPRASKRSATIDSVIEALKRALPQTEFRG